MLVRCESAKEEVSVQVSLVVSSSKSRVAATWLGGVDCDVASRQSSSSRIRLGWRHPLDLAGGAAVSTSTRCDRPLHSVLGTGWEASCVKTASILVDAEGRTALVPDLLAGRKKPPLSKSSCCVTYSTSFESSRRDRGHCLTLACVLDKDSNRALQQLLSVSNTCSGQVLDFSNTSSHPLSPFRLVSAGSKASK